MAAKNKRQFKNKDRNKLEKSREKKQRKYSEPPDKRKKRISNSQFKKEYIEK